ncbi:hypothetical protein BDR06DRAFT_957630 [Suillus hirtellus]|nr:hypothetical protein BDR06DRAFT_957630 [Suillus hirtellus]
MDPSEIREKIGRFRILVIGRANAGKTTILQRVCNTRENPEIYNSAGEKIDDTVLKASRERGLHNIENEMVFQSNPGFIFHDSRGFEAGGESEFNIVKAFIADRSKEARLRDQLHAIWYCIPMDEACRSFTQGEIKFFSQCDTGSIPVIVLFTKFDALYDEAYAQLRKKGTPWKDAKGLAPKHAEESFAIGWQLKFLYDSKKIQRPPKCHICLPNMDRDDADCGSLIEQTAGALDNDTLQQLFVSTQKTNLEICMKYAVEKSLMRHLDFAETPTSKDYERMVGASGDWFPHIDLNWRHRAEMRSKLLSTASDSSPLENIVQLCSALVIVFEHSFYIFDKRRHQRQSIPSLYVALEQYMASQHAAAVREGVSAAVQAYEEAVATAAHAYEEAVKAFVYTYQGKSPAWIAKLPFEPFKRKAVERSQEAKQSFERSKQEEKESLCSQAKAQLMKTILEITLNHRLPRP